jgi:type I restriction enzyme S subunit
MTASAVRVAERVSSAANDQRLELRPLADVADILDSRRIPVNSKERDTRVGSIPYYGATGQVGWIDGHLFDEELVLLGEDGAPFLEPFKAKAYVIRGKSWVNNHAHVLRAREVPTGWLAHHLNTISYEGLVTGTTRLKLTQAAMRQIRVPVAPRPVMERIVSEIETQFSRLDEAVANLKRVKANLKRYRAAVLKAAVEGRLVPTEADLARRENRTYETGEQLLARILDERRAAWEEQTASGRKRKDLEPPLPDTSSLPTLSEGWAWTRLDAISALKGGITVDQSRRDPTSRRVPYLRVANVQRGHLDVAEMKEIDASEEDIKALRLENGDILFTEGGDRDKLGRGWIWENQITECIHQNHVFRGRLYLKTVSPKFISWWGNSYGQIYFQREGKQTTNLASINLTKLNAFPVPLPPAAEQHRIVAEVERRFSMADKSEAQVDANLLRAERLRQAILKRAFEARLG